MLSTRGRRWSVAPPRFTPATPAAVDAKPRARPLPFARSDEARPPQPRPQRAWLRQGPLTSRSSPLCRSVLSVRALRLLVVFALFWGIGAGARADPTAGVPWVA